jgi:hypothetical protein
MTFSRLSLTILTFLCLSSSAVPAEDAGGCDKFKWSVAREHAWFAGAPKLTVSGDTLTLADNAFAVALKLTDSAGYVLPPERAPKPGTFGATLTISSIDKAGSHQFTLSKRAWIHVIQNGVRVKSSAFSGQGTCSVVHKSVRFDLSAGPLVVEISNSESDSIGRAIAPAQ